MSRRLPILLLAALTACASNSRSFRCEARGGPPWTEYRSQHFVVDTDAQPERAAKFLDRLELLQLLEIRALVGGEVDIPGRLRVIGFSSQRDFRDVAPVYSGGYFTFGQFLEPTIVVPLDLVSVDGSVLAHELAHYLSKYFFPLQPSWYAEGIAQFIETLGAPVQAPADPATGSHMVRPSKAPPHSVGRIPTSVRGWPASIAPIPVRTLLSWQGKEDETVPGLFHASSWLLYHWLWNYRSAQLTNFQKRLSDGQMPGAAWAAAFPEYDAAHPAELAALDTELDRYRRNMSFVSYAVAGETSAKFDERPLSSADAHAILLSARARWPADSEERRRLQAAQMAEALREDPRNPVAAVFTPDPPAKPDVQKLRVTASQAPGDWRAWHLLSYALEGAEKEAALRKAAQLNPDNALVQNSLAWLLVTSDRAREALPVANRALDLAPWDPNIVDTLAEVAARVGQCPQAVQLEERAVAMNPNDDDQHKRQADIQRRCVKTGATLPAPPSAPSGP